ncbi:MAG: hypothetical protein AABW45_00595 [Nanoarchaeota archaeon]
MKDEKFNLKEEYNKLKHKIPRFEDLDNEFELSTANIKDKSFLLRNIRRRLNDKIIFYCRIIEGLLYPNSNSITGMMEINSFNEKEKEKMANIYKKLMEFERESLSLDVNPDEKNDVEFINNLFKEWKKFKEEMIKVTKKMKESWHLEEKEEKDNYFG